MPAVPLAALQPFSFIVSDDTVACPVTRLVKAQRLFIAIQIHGQRDPADDPLTATNPATDAVLDTSVADRARRFARAFGGHVERNAFTPIIRDKGHADLRHERPPTEGRRLERTGKI